MTNEASKQTNFQTQFETYISMVERALPGYLPGHDTLQGDVVRAMEYSLLDGGKRIRAVLLLAVYRLFCRDDAQVKGAIPFAAAVEMIHASSLIHDDLPCMDDDDLRRGKPSCHIAFGEDIALLAGDALIALAAEITTAPSLLANFDGAAVLAASHALMRAMGTGGMIGGQVIDLQSEGKTISMETLRAMDEKKTGALIAVTAEIGCILGGATDSQLEACVRYAMDIGHAFQITDDILDRTSDTETLGKPVGSDEDNQKCTYTSFYGIDTARQQAAALTRQAVEGLRDTGLETGFLEELAEMLLHRKK